MPKSRTRKGCKTQSGGGFKSADETSLEKGRRLNIIIAGVVAILAVALAFYWWDLGETKREFLVLALKGKGALSQVTNERSLGGGHLRPGQTRTYTSQFPTSGSHHRTPTEPGYYETHQPPIHLVHALEHGHIVIYYDKPDAEALKILRVWSGLYSGQWDGVVVTPKPGLGQKIVLTAWAKRLDQSQLDMPLAAAFIDAFRGRGPENPVR